MKKVLSRIGQIFIYLTYPILIVAVIILGVLLIDRVNQFNNLDNSFRQAATALEQDKTDKQITIEDLKQQYTDLTAEVGRLRSENASLKQSLQNSELEGYGSVSGKIFPVVTTGTKDFSQYQLVCAEGINNTSAVHCRSVSALQQNFTLSVPAGVYRVYAQLYPQPASDSPLAGVKAYYTEYVQCAQKGSIDKCDEKKQTKAVEVTIKAGDTVTNIDPIGWN